MDSEAVRGGAELGNPLLYTFGIKQLKWQPGLSEFSLTVEPRHLNHRGSLQGGVIATLLDVACGYAGMWVESSASAGTAVTVMLNISYLASVNDGIVIARGHITGGGRGIYFSEGEVVTEDGKLIATAQGAFKRGGLPG
jgi:uncharacterized protein (TIGR00369 family)